MNLSRVNFKHHGTTPSDTTLAQVQADVSTFLSDSKRSWKNFLGRRIFPVIAGTIRRNRKIRRGNPAVQRP